ncbi:MAG: MFS transporter [Pseudomonadota bacterium]
MHYKLNSKKPQLLFLILLISFPSVAAVLITPALPHIGDFFRVSNSYVQQLVTIFVVGYAVGQLLYSPFANRWGRKPAIYIGLSLYLLSCLVCLLGIYLHDLQLVICGRLFMALGSSVGMIISFTIINDFYSPQKARSMVGYTVLAYAFMPALAIFIGGIITSHLSWIDCFYFYFFYGLVIFIISIFLPETLKEKNVNALKINDLIRDYRSAFSTWRIILFSLIYGLMTSFIYVLASGGPFIGIDTIGLSPALYGMWLIIPYCGQFIGSITAGKLTKQLSVYQLMALGYGSTIIGSVFMFISFLSGWVTTFSFMFAIFFIMLGLPMVYSSSSVMALFDYQDKATGSAVMTFITMSITLMATFIFTLLPNDDPIMMPGLFVVTLVVATLAFIVAKYQFIDY